MPQTYQNDFGSRWIEDEFTFIAFGDNRLDRRLFRILEDFSHHPSEPIDQASADWAATNAAYRFFENPR